MTSSMFRFTLTRFLISVLILGTGFGLIAYAAKFGLEAPWRAAGALVGAARAFDPQIPTPGNGDRSTRRNHYSAHPRHLMNVAILE